MLRSEDGDYRLRGTHQLAGLANRKLSLFSEQRVLPHLAIADLRPDLFAKARSLMRAGSRRHPWLAFSDEELLKVGGFFNRDPNSGQPGLTLAAALLFGSDEVIQSAVPGYKFDCLLRRRNQDRYDDRLIIRFTPMEPPRSSRKRNIVLSPPCHWVLTGEGWVMNVLPITPPPKATNKSPNRSSNRSPNKSAVPTNMRDFCQF
ncbi:hypothetical protein ACHHRT_13490 [Desulfurivibrio sp. D14AmB]|uniref:hypothetical protein n=1 Tax=Desulfurivibrio sp. D14AmB TaxID=3374370 RepID=UPI00376EC83A